MTDRLPEARVAKDDEIAAWAMEKEHSDETLEALLFWQRHVLAREVLALREQVTAMEGALKRGEASDGYHTHRELYEYRMLYHAHAAAGWLSARIPVVKSWRHGDGGLCFGGGWFIVSAELPTGQVTNHYKAEHWHLFAVPEVEQAPEWDGHTPADASERLRLAMALDLMRFDALTRQVTALRALAEEALSRWETLDIFASALVTDGEYIGDDSERAALWDRLAAIGDET